MELWAGVRKDFIEVNALIVGSQIQREPIEHSDIKFCFSFLKIHFSNSKTKK